VTSPVQTADARKHFPDYLRGDTITIIRYYQHPRYGALVPGAVLEKLTMHIEAWRNGEPGAAEKLAAYVNARIAETEGHQE